MTVDNAEFWPLICPACMGFAFAQGVNEGIYTQEDVAAMVDGGTRVGLAARYDLMTSLREDGEVLLPEHECALADESGYICECGCQMEAKYEMADQGQRRLLDARKRAEGLRAERYAEATLEREQSTVDLAQKMVLKLDPRLSNEWREVRRHLFRAANAALSEHRATLYAETGLAAELIEKHPTRPGHIDCASALATAARLVELLANDHDSWPDDWRD